MPSWQRKRGKSVTFFPRKLIIDQRGNEVYTTDTENSITVTYTENWLRSSQAEVPGQQTIDIRRITVPATLPYDYVTVWARCTFPGSTETDSNVWDVDAPPALHYGTSQTRHWTVQIRRRPDLNG